MLTAVMTAWVITCMVASPARAADEGETVEVHSLLTEAVSEYDAHRYEEARALFRRVHQIAPSARTLRGIGMASFELRDYVQALQSLEGSLAEQRKPLTPEQRRHVERLIERTNAYLGRFVINLTPADAVLRVDGQTAAITSGSLLMLGFGTHTISADAPGFSPQTRELTVMGGERQDLSFELRAVDPDSAGVAGRQPGADARTMSPSLVASAPPGAGARSGAVYWFVGAGALALGAVVGGLWAYQASTELGRCRDAGSACSNEDTLMSRRNLAVGLTVGLAAGAAVVAVVGSVVNSRKPQTSSGLALACAPGPGTVQCAFNF